MLGLIAWHHLEPGVGDLGFQVVWSLRLGVQGRPKKPCPLSSSSWRPSWAGGFTLPLSLSLSLFRVRIGIFLFLHEILSQVLSVPEGQACGRPKDALLQRGRPSFFFIASNDIGQPCFLQLFRGHAFHRFCLLYSRV